MSRIKEDADTAFIRDLTRARQRAEAQEARMQAVLETVIDAVITIDRRGIIQSTNKATTKIFGYAQSELEGRNIKMLMPEPERSHHDRYLRRYAKTGIKHVIGKPREVNCMRKDGARFPVELAISEQVIGKELFFTGVLRDISERKLAEENLRRIEGYMFDAIETVADGFVIFDEHDKLVMCNKRYKEIYAKSAEQIHPGASFEDILRKGLEAGQYVDAVGREEEWLSERLEAHRNPKGKIEQQLGDGAWLRIEERRSSSGAIVGVRSDITELKERENELRRSKERLSATINSALDCVISMDKAGRVIDFNPAAERTFGYSHKEVVGRELSDLIIPEELRELHRKGLAHYLATGEGPVIGKRIEVAALRADGSRFPCELAIDVAQSDEGPLFVAFLRDITDQKQVAQDLVDAKERAEAANTAKDGFLAMMSHEIRTPLNGVLGVLGLLQGTALDEAQSSYVETGLDSAQSLLNIISDILDFSKMEAGKLDLEETHFDLVALLASIEELLRPQVAAKGIGFRLSIAKNIPPWLVGDPGRIRQVMLNLVGNALKFTSEGGIRMEAFPVKTDGPNLTVRFQVIDTGIGIPQDQHDQLFTAFTTLDASYSRKFGGTGLGLAISMHLVTLMGGAIEFTSRPDIGSMFWFDLPLSAGEPEPVEEQLGLAAHEAPPLVDGKKARILLAEDNPANALVAKTMLEKQGLKVDTAANGLEAVEAARTRGYDLILMDVAMPEMDGFEATKAIRRLPGRIARAPIIAMTAHAMQGYRDKVIKGGMDDYLTKPVDKKRMFDVLGAWIGQLADDQDDVESPESTDPLVDRAVINQLGVDTDPSMLPEMIDIFIEDAIERLDVISQAFETEDADSLERETHTLGSSAGTFGAMRLHVIARRLEALCKEGDAEAAFAMIPELEEVGKDSVAALKDLS